MKQIYSGIKKEIDILSVKRKTNAMVNGEVNTQTLFLHYVKCRVTHGAAYTTRLMMAINSHPRSPRYTDFRTLHSQCWSNYNVIGRAWVTEDGNSLVQTILELFLRKHCMRWSTVKLTHKLCFCIMLNAGLLTVRLTRRDS